MGARVRGNSLIKNKMQVELIPDPTQIHMRIATQGSVESSTQAQKSGFTVDNQGFARFRVFKRLAFGRHGVQSDLPVAYSSSNNQMVGMSSKLDPIPIVGWMAKRIAQQKIEAEAPKAEAQVKQKLESTARAQMHKEVESQLAKTRNYLYQNMLQPLTAMDLEPDPIQMSTYRSSIVMRYRLAGREQMAASTSRPLPTQGSLMSFSDS